MAENFDVEDVVEEKRNSTEKKEEEIELKVVPKDDSDIQDSKNKQKSRFKVNKVEFKEDKETVPDNDAGGGDHVESLSPPTSPLISDSYNSHSFYDTHNLKTFGHNTNEALPHVDHYRNLLSTTQALKSRPTLQELHEEKEAPKPVHHHKILDAHNIENGTGPAKDEVQVQTKTPSTVVVKFGWIKGVLVRCLLNIWGVMLFLRLSWVVGQAGIGLGATIILLATVVTVITSLSMSAICTNGEVKGGGAYYMISRSLGPEFGGAIGIIFSMANAVAVAMYVVGFAETVRDIMKEYDALMTDEMNDVRIIGCITIVLLLGVSIAGMEWEAKAQLILLAILIIAMVNFTVGTFIPPSMEEQSQGFLGYQGRIFETNFGPDFRDGEGFFSVFSIFFPAATGILAGANISGDLADPQRAIPKGTLLAIIITTISYICFAVMVGSCVVRDATGCVMDAEMFSHNSSNCSQVAFEYGLLNNFQVMELVSGFGPLIYAGIFAATLSSALASLVSAPKVFQAVCKDKIFPKIHIFAKGYGRTGEEPWRAYILTFIIATGFILIGELNAIAPLISNFFLMAYALINYSCFDASLSKSPGWRPAFKYYSQWVSLAGAMLCLVVMFIINWWAALVTFVCVTALYVYVHYSKPDVNWGSSTQAHAYRNALQQTLKLISVEEHVKNFRPQLLVLSGLPMTRPSLIDFASDITKGIGLMVCGHYIKGDVSQVSNIKTAAVHNWLHKRKAKAFYNFVAASDFRTGIQSLLEVTGLGKLKPNTVLMGFKSNWQTDKPENVEEYLHIIHDTLDLRYGVGILRVKEGFDFSESMVIEPVIEEEPRNEEQEALLMRRAPSVVMAAQMSAYSEEDIPHGQLTAASSIGSMTMLEDLKSNKIQIDVGGPSSDEDEEDDEVEEAGMSETEIEKEEADIEKGKEVEKESKDKNENSISRSGSRKSKNKKGILSNINRDILQAVNRFQRKQKKGTIDVWWLFDDGGLTMLIPYILSTKSHWSNCDLRVFTAGTKKKELDRDQKNMATLLSKFRIDYSKMTVIPDIGKKPKEESIAQFKTLIKPWVLDEEAGETEEMFPWKISEAEMLANKDKNYRHIRLRELLMEHSHSEASLIVMTLPMPRKGTCGAGLYMAWLETLTKDMPPILLLRGNQTSVLTYYS
ncbi:solute carrier family 12 member 1 [Lingula anatina]|uniref:Solute carrier family 12 member 1 n=1 Tax=Lingula anatina TaxID=7574 RepID=A0A1S3IT47_LINAN|nr:solute carrier family 12 member 1 [Lingula anatina]XP_013401324.1 solute carrier family 12 member 1 [Lingula anatina]|eukprot:XP_013401253.1 solute carrier family 12 member 1 [Lingula anatina]